MTRKNVAKNPSVLVMKVNWYGIDHDDVKKRFEGNPQFVNDFCVNGETQPSAVYRVAKPNKAKGHKKYLLLTKVSDGFIVRGMSAQKINQFRYQDALLCLRCNQVIYSIQRHHYHICFCDSIFIDGGRDYTRIGARRGCKYESVTLDLLTDTIFKP